MGTISENQQRPQKATFSNSAKPDRPSFRQLRDEDFGLHAGCTTADPAGQRLVEDKTEDKKAIPARGASTEFGHDFSRIPFRSSPRGVIQPKLIAGDPEDRYEQEARRMADQIERRPDIRPRPQENGDGSAAGQATALDTVDRREGGSRQIQTDALRSYFEPRFGYDFSRVRIHSDAGAQDMAASLNARAFTVGRDIFFGPGAYAPHEAEGRRLMAHELTHVIHQGAAEQITEASQSFLSIAPGHVQRDIAEERLADTPVEEIMADEHYFENGIQRIEFYSAELAILHYEDGSEIRLGLVPDQITAPFEAVDYRTSRSAHIPVSPTAPSLGRGSVKFLPRGREARLPPGATFGDLPRIVEAVGRTIRFTHHPNGRIVPTEVNTISAPRLCEALRGAEAEFVRNFDAMSEGAIQVLETLEWVIILASLVGGLAAAGARTGGRAAAGRAAAAGSAVGAAGRAQGTLARLFGRLLGSGASEAITVEGVGFGGVRAAMRGTELVVSRTTIVNASRIPAQGRLIHGAFEQAAIQTARSAGARTARVALELVQNRTWAAYLESQGYAFEVLEHGTRVTRVLTKVFTL